MELDEETIKIIKYECRRAHRKLTKGNSMNMYEPMDFFSIGWQAATKAIKNYDPNKNNLARFLHLSIRNRILDYLRQLSPITRNHLEKIKQGTMKFPAHVELANAAEICDSYSDIESIDICDTISFITKDCTERDRAMFFNMVLDNYTGADMSRLYNISEARVGQIINPLKDYMRVHLMQTN